MLIRTYNIKLNGDKAFIDFWISLLANTKEAYNTCSQLICENKLSFSLVPVHNFCYDKLREQFPMLPSQAVIRVEREVVAAYKSKKSNKQKGKNPYRHSLSMTLDKRLYSNFTSEGISLVSETPNKRKRFSFVLYPKIMKLFSSCIAKDPTMFYRNGDLFLSIPFESTGCMPSSITSLGVDLGMKRLFVTSEGNYFADKEYLKERRKLRYLKRCLQAKGTPSAKKHLRKVSKKEQSLSKNMCHKAVNTLLNSTSASYIIMEDLSKIKSKTSKGTSGFKRTKHNNAIGQVPFYLFKQILTYKATLVGKQVVSVSPTYTSQTDSTNGKLEGKRQGCRFYSTNGIVLDADWNAAVNIAKRAKHPLSTECLPQDGKLNALSGMALSTAKSQDA